MSPGRACHGSSLRVTGHSQPAAARCPARAWPYHPRARGAGPAYTCSATAHTHPLLHSPAGDFGGDDFGGDDFGDSGAEMLGHADLVCDAVAQAWPLQCALCSTCPTPRMLCHPQAAGAALSAEFGGDDHDADIDFDAGEASAPAAAEPESVHSLPSPSGAAAAGEGSPGGSNPLAYVTSARRLAARLATALTLAAGSSHPPREFNAAFRERCEQKDEAEAAAKAQRKAAGKEEFQAWLSERQNAIAKRQDMNRQDESALQEQLLADLEGDSWARVVSLVDPAEPKSADKDITRMKDVLLRVKSNPSVQSPA